MNWPLETVTLVDVSLWPVNNWVGYCVPYYIGELPNRNTASLYTLEFECGQRWTLGVGDLYECAWRALISHEHYCTADKSPSLCGQDGNLPSKISVLSL